MRELGRDDVVVVRELGGEVDGPRWVVVRYRGREQFTSAAWYWGCGAALIAAREEARDGATVEVRRADQAWRDVPLNPDVDAVRGARRCADAQRVPVPVSGARRDGGGDVSYTDLRRLSLDIWQGVKPGVYHWRVLVGWAPYLLRPMDEVKGVSSTSEDAQRAGIAALAALGVFPSEQPESVKMMREEG